MMTQSVSQLRIAANKNRRILVKQGRRITRTATRSKTYGIVNTSAVRCNYGTCGMQGIQCLFDLREMQPNERIEKVMQIVTRRDLTAGMYMGFVGDIDRQMVLRYEDNRTIACGLETLRISDLIRCLQPITAADQCLSCFPEGCEPGALPVNGIQ